MTWVTFAGAGNSSYDEVRIDPAQVTGFAQRSDGKDSPRVDLLLSGGRKLTVKGTCEEVAENLKAGKEAG